MMLYRELVATLLLVFAGLALANFPGQQQQQMHLPSDLYSRFEYKNSFKGPHLVDRKGRVPFWTVFGNALPSSDQVRLTPSIRSMQGHIWGNQSYEAEHWSVEIWLRVTGRGSVGGDGMAVWFRDQKGQDGNVFGVSDKWVGMGIILDSYDNDGGLDNPMLSLVINDGTKEYDHHTDGRLTRVSQCKRDFRNRAHPVRLRIRYLDNRLQVEYDHGSAAEPVYEVCMMAQDVQLPRKGYFGISAATGGLADDHDVLKFLTTTLSRTPFVSGTVPTMKEEEVAKAQNMFNEYSDTLEKQKVQFAKDHPDQIPFQDQSVLHHQSPFDRGVVQILESVQELKEVTKNMQASLNANPVQAASPGGQQQQQQMPNFGATNAMISQSLARLSQEVQQVMRRNQEETSGILRMHGEAVRRIETNAGNPHANMPSPGLLSIGNTLQQQQQQVEGIVRQLSDLQAAVAASASSESSGSCLTYTTLFVVIGVEAVLFLALHLYQRRTSAAAEKKFF